VAVINLSFVNCVYLKIFFPDLIDKTKTPQYILVSVLSSLSSSLRLC